MDPIKPLTGKLFRILVLAAGPKNSHTSTETFLVANSEQDVFDWVAKNKAPWAWSEAPEEGQRPNMRCTDDGKDIPFREWVMLKRGDLEDDEGWDEAYYGVTKWGWQPIESSPEDIAVLVRLGIAELATPLVAETAAHPATAQSTNIEPTLNPHDS